MPKFRYTATDAFRARVTGTYEANSADEVRIYLERNNLAPEKIGRAWLAMEISVGRGLKGRDIVAFTRMFAAMARAGMPMDEALKILHHEMDAPALKRAIQRMIIDVEGGGTLTAAFERHPKVFTQLMVNMVAAGEEGGRLDETLDRLADMMESNEEINATIRGAMIYPAALFAMSIGVVVVLLTFVLPNFIEMFTESGVPLPLPTRITVATADLLSEWWWALGLGVIALAYGAIRVARIDKVAWQIDRLILKVPICGTIAQKAAVVRFSRTMSTLYQGGTDVIEAMGMAGRTAGNRTITAGVDRACEDIRQGRPIAQALNHAGVLPSMVIAMIRIGEESGVVDAMLDQVASFYDRDVRNAVSSATKLIEPAMLIFMAVLVGMILASMYLPMFDMIGVAGSPM